LRVTNAEIQLSVVAITTTTTTTELQRLLAIRSNGENPLGGLADPSAAAKYVPNVKP
jgi:hypothetical protein